MLNVVFVAPYVLESTSRFLSATVEVPGARVAVVGSSLARALYGADSSIGRTLSLAGETYTVVGELAHWDLDRWLKVAASRAGSVVSATGALYAVRRELVQPVVAGVTDDFYVSTGVIAAGRRLVFAPDATVHEPVSSSAIEEFGRTFGSLPDSRDKRFIAALPEWVLSRALH